jgi:hypothetical protein
MKVRERVMMSALGAILHERDIEIVVHDFAGTFHLRFDSERGALLMDEIEKDAPLSRAATGGVLIVQNAPPKEQIN